MRQCNILKLITVPLPTSQWEFWLLMLTKCPPEHLQIPQYCYFWTTGKPGKPVCANRRRYEGAGWAPCLVFSQKTLFSCQRQLHHWHFVKDLVGVGVSYEWDIFDEGTLLGNIQFHHNSGPALCWLCAPTLHLMLFCYVFKYYLI